MWIFLPNHDNILCQHGIFCHIRKIFYANMKYSYHVKGIFYANMKYSYNVKTQIEMEFFMIIGLQVYYATTSRNHVIYN
jgi:hypothetical protein